MTTAKQRKFNIEDYDYYVREYIRKSDELGKPISHAMLRKDPFNLPDARWYVNNCPDKSVKRWADFVDWCGFIAKSKKPTKEKMIKLIYKLQDETNHPLMYDDFRGNGCYHPPIEMIRQYWGTINNMKKELGLEIVQESMIEKTLSKDTFDNTIREICDYIFNDGRNFTTIFEIDSINKWNSGQNLNKYSKKYYGVTLGKLFEKYNLHLGQQGCGINYDFDDGEHITSQFEYMFSKFLRDNGLKYNLDYFRDVKYSSFIDKYSGNMNCDYVIHISDKIIYIEIAGIIESYKEWYYSNKSITRSKSKEKYRQKLYAKESMLKSNNLIYFILFPCDLTKENFKNILYNPSLELKKEIENFNQNNIDWVKIREVGELDYSKPFRRDTKPKKKEVA